MLQSELYVFQDATYTDDPERIIASGMVKKLSDVIDLEYANINNGGSNLWLVVSVKDDDDAAGGLGYNIDLMECATEDGTYTVASTKFVAIADIVTGKYVWKVALPQDLKRYVKVRLQAKETATPGSELLITAAAASDTPTKVAGLIYAARAQFGDAWVVTNPGGALTTVVFTAAEDGVNTGTRSFDGGATGITASIAETQAGAADAKAIYTLTVLTKCFTTGYIKINLDALPMTGDAHFNAAIVTG